MGDPSSIVRASSSPSSRAPRSRVRAAGLVFAGVVLLALATFDAARSRPSTDVGTIPRAARSATTDLSAPTSPSTESSRRQRRGRDLIRSTPLLSIHSGRLEDVREQSLGSSPVRLLIPAISVDALIEPVGVEPDTSQVAIPGNVSDVGWYRFGPRPGDDGSAVIVGHVDARSQGPGALFRLSDLDPGDRLVVAMSDGTRRMFSIVARRQYPKYALPPQVFRRSGAPQLAMITCGGPFDQATGHYRDNIVVYAVPA